MTKTQRTGLILGIIGFLFPFVISFPGQSLAGHIAMSIFLLATGLPVWFKA